MNRQERLLKRILNHLRFYTTLAILGLIIGVVIYIDTSDDDVAFAIMGLGVIIAILTSIIVGFYNWADRRDWKRYDKDIDNS